MIGQIFVIFNFYKEEALIRVETTVHYKIIRQTMWCAEN